MKTNRKIIRKREERVLWESFIKEDGTLITPNNITEIPDCVLMDCDSLRSIIIPDGVTSIGRSAFRGCKNLISITIPNSVTSIGRSAFEYCISLTSVIIPDNVTNIGGWAFRFCTSLTSVTIGSSVTDIGPSAFWYCHKLVAIYNKSKLNLEAGSDSYGEVGYYALGIYTDINTPSGKVIVDSNGFVVLAYDKEKILVNYVGDKTKIVIPNNITKINNYAFCGCHNLTSVIIPNSVTSIGYAAFHDCTSLTSVTIGENVTSIGNFAFDGWRPSLTIYCEAESKPEGWDCKWDSGFYPVIWGYKGGKQ